MSQELSFNLLESIEEIVKKTKRDSIWDDYCQIVTVNKKHFVYLTNFIEETQHYNKLYFMMQNANKDEEFCFIINSLGGIIDSTYMIIDAIENTKAKVTCRLTGTVASAATIIALSCDDIEVSKNLSFMIHNYSASGLQGKGHEMKARQNFMDKEFNKVLNEYYKGFLTNEEIEEAIEGRDLWLNSEEVITRWEKRKALKIKNS